MYDDKNKRPQYPHNVILEDRLRLSVTGVEDVESFDDNTVVLYTTKGALTVHGSGLHIDRLSIDGGELCVDGNISALQYEDEVAPQGGFWSRLFR